MSTLSKQSIRKLCVDVDQPLITPFEPEKINVNGKSRGLSHASYDCAIAHDLVLGVNPAFILAKYAIKLAELEAQILPSTLQDVERSLKKQMAELRQFQAEELRNNPPMAALAHTIEDFWMPDNVQAQVADKSTYARLFISAFNTYFDPGFHGNATLELVNHSPEPITYKAGDPVCQFVFTWLDETTESPYRGKYQGQTKAAHGARFEEPSA